jgi:putative transposase
MLGLSTQPTLLTLTCKTNSPCLQYHLAMRTYKRLNVDGGCYFFTVNLAVRHGNNLLIREIDALRKAFRETLVSHPLELDAIVVLPEHLHTIWQLPPGDSDFSTRWRLIKSRFSRRVARAECVSPSRERKGERGIWQRRYWEHLIRNDDDYAQHIDYIHYNPVKHGHCSRPADWPYSSFARWVEKGVYPQDWAASAEIWDLLIE